jgi:nucleotide-binding universal stress UspA family protein
MEVATALARDMGANLTIIHSVEEPAYPELGSSTDLEPAIRSAVAPKLEAALEAARATCPGARAILRFGVASEEIVAAAGEVGADLIVVGTHGRRGLAHAMLGSVAEHVVRVSPVPVLTVRSAAR